MKLRISVGKDEGYQPVVSVDIQAIQNTDHIDTVVAVLSRLREIIVDLTPRQTAGKPAK